MYGAAPRGDIKKRDLADDDIEGLCTIYPLVKSNPVIVPSLVDKKHRILP